MKKLFIYLFCFTNLLFPPIIYASNSPQALAYHKNHAKSHVTTSDANIVTQIENKLKADPSLCNSRIALSAKLGVVHLSGKVNFLKEAERAISIAQSIKNVMDVDASGLLVGKSHAAGHTVNPDTAITGKVKGALAREGLLNLNSDTGIKVETENGVVYLKGCTNNPDKAYQIVKIANSVCDIARVVNAICIKQ